MACLHFEHIVAIVSAYFYMAINNKEYIQFWLLFVVGYGLFITRQNNKKQERKIEELEYTVNYLCGDIESYKSNIHYVENKYNNLVDQIETIYKNNKKESNKLHKRISKVYKRISGIEFDISNIHYDLEQIEAKFSKIHIDIEDLEETVENTDNNLMNIHKIIEKHDQTIHKVKKETYRNGDVIEDLISTTDRQFEFVKNDLAVVLELYDELKTDNNSVRHLNSVCSSPFRKLELEELEGLAENDEPNESRFLDLDSDSDSDSHK